MKQNCHPHQWFQDNPLLPSRRVFEQKDGGPNMQSSEAEEEENAPKTLESPEPVDYPENHETHEEDAPETTRNGGPPTLRSNEAKIEPIPPTLRSEDLLRTMDSSKAETAEVIRDTVMRTLEAKVAKLEEELAEKRKKLEKKDKEIGQLEEESTELAAKNEILGVENSDLKKLALEEPLTGLGTKGYFNERMLGMVDESIRYGKDFSLLFIDLDRFKDINDKAGHLAGDEALRHLGDIIHDTMRISDTGFRLEEEKQGKGFRYGGEEIVIILPDTDKDEAHIAAERLRKTIETELKSHLAGAFPDKRQIIEREIMGTASIGVTSYYGSERGNDEDDETLVKILIEEADQAMFAAKAGGRNQVHAHREKRDDKEIDKALLEATIDNEELDAYAAEILQNARKVPEDQRMEALKRATDQTMDELKKRAS